MTKQWSDFSFEYVAGEDPALDFCLWEYNRPRPLQHGDLRSVNLLYAAAAHFGQLGQIDRLITSLRRNLGLFRTVWGLKNSDTGLSAEFYFYDYDRLERAFSFAQIARAFAPLAEVVVPVDDRLPYFMTSVELDLPFSSCLPTVRTADIYIGNPDTAMSSGLCYEVGSAGIRLKNLYHFFDAQADWGSVVAKTACSAHVPLGSVSVDEIFPTWLREARVAVVANKPHSDGAYMSGIGIDALIHFCERFGYPAAVTEFARTHRDGLSHLHFDVGYDYRVVDGRVVTGKTSLYNVL
jgi:hypothetical protein